MTGGTRLTIQHPEGMGFDEAIEKVNRFAPEWGGHLIQRGEASIVLAFPCSEDSKEFIEVALAVMGSTLERHGWKNGRDLLASYLEEAGQESA